MNYSGACIFFIVFMIVLSGCSSSTGSSLPAQSPAIAVSSPTQTAVSTETTEPAATPTVLKDPLAGSWKCTSYIASGPLEKIYTFFENQTWTRTNRNLKTRVKSFAVGTWKAGGNGRYILHVQASGNTATFSYDSAKDTLYEPTFQETFYRTASPVPPAPVLGLALNSEHKADALQNARPRSGYRYLILNVTLRNIQENESFPLDERSMWVMYDDTPGTYVMTDNMVGYLEDPLPLGTLAPGEARQGNVIFSVPTGTHSYTLKLVDSHGDDAAERISFGNTTG